MNGESAQTSNSTSFRERASSQRAPSPRAPQGGFALGSWLGVRVHVDWSLSIIFALIVFNLGSVVLPDWHPDWPGTTVWGVALAAALLFFLSVLLHELSHAVVGRMQGMQIERITLFLFGGMAHLTREPTSPKSEFLMAFVGPLTSLAIGVGAMALGGQLSGDQLALAVEARDEVGMSLALANASPVSTLLLWLGPINVLLAVFNVIPGFPLDGGRVLRSILWGATRDFQKATRWAAAVGQMVAWGFMGVGALGLFQGAFLSGLWLLLIGWFLNNAARASYERVLLERALGDVPVRRVMRAPFERVSPDLSVEQFVRQYLLKSEQSSFPVQDAEGHLLGLVTFQDVRRHDQASWATLTVADVMTAEPNLVQVTPSTSARHAFDQLAQRDLEQLPVVDDRQLVGLVRRADLMKWVALSRSAGRHGSLEPGGAES